MAAGFAARAGWLAVKKLEHWHCASPPASLLESTRRELQLKLEQMLLCRLSEGQGWIIRGGTPAYYV